MGWTISCTCYRVSESDRITAEGNVAAVDMRPTVIQPVGLAGSPLAANETKPSKTRRLLVKGFIAAIYMLPTGLNWDIKELS